MNDISDHRISRCRDHTKIQRKALTLPAALLLACAFSWQVATAHHSYAMFDSTKRTTVKGAIAKIEWKNPHAFVWLYVAYERSEYELYGFECDSINNLVRQGLTKSTLAIGEEVSIEFLPLKDGRHGGRPITITRTNGSVLQLLPPGAASPPTPTAPRSE